MVSKELLEEVQIKWIPYLSMIHSIDEVGFLFLLNELLSLQINARLRAREPN